MIRHAIEKGVAPLAIYRAASISGARAFGLADRGIVAPGWRADLVVLDSLEGCHAQMVFSAGREVDRRAVRHAQARRAGRARKRPGEAGDGRRFQDRGEGQRDAGDRHPARQDHHRTSHRRPSRRGRRASADLDNDIIRVAVVERHGRNGNIGSGFVQGFGLKRGAIASTVGHDSHNIGVVGVSDEDMAFAVNRLGELQGGFVVAEDGKVLAEIALPVAGLMSLDDHETVRASAREAARRPRAPSASRWRSRSCSSPSCRCR